MSVDAQDAAASGTDAFMSAPGAQVYPGRPEPQEKRRSQATARVKVAFDWRRGYYRRLWFTDLVIILIVVFGTQWAWLGFGNVRVVARQDALVGAFSYWGFSSGLVVLWMWVLTLADTRTHRVAGNGVAEYVRIVRSSLMLFGMIAILAFLTKVDVARGYLLISLPVGVIVLLVSRWTWRQWLFARRRKGEFTARVLLVGSDVSSAQVAEELARDPSAGFRVVGACVPAGRSDQALRESNIPVYGELDDVTRALEVTSADTVIITNGVPARKVKHISWILEAGRQHLILAPSIMDVAGPRLHTRPVAGLPLMHVETPRLSRGQLVLKRWFDIVVASLITIVLSPVLLVVALVVKLTSPGPVLFKQERIGHNGAPFKMLKFRSMRVGADAELAGLLAERGTSDAPLFKVKDDPRITRAGRVLRKYSLDELPQLFNVIGGSMSLVGPRPQVAAEVALYSDAAHRRLLAKPGITGSWQVGGRSTLSWEEAIRLDLSYIENWSLVGDIGLLARTVRAVIVPGDSAH
jgi:exopolysaccharide biosynthesis polyprenyl glycosylphosphotransferase